MLIMADRVSISNVLDVLFEYTQIHHWISFRRIHVCTMKVYFRLSWISERVESNGATQKYRAEKESR